MQLMLAQITRVSKYKIHLEKIKQINFYIKQKNVDKLTKLINELIAKHDK